MMLGQMHAVKTVLVGGAVELQSFIVQLRQRFVASADVIKKANLHFPCSPDRAWGVNFRISGQGRDAAAVLPRSSFVRRQII
jgi:hypothetical protein